MRLDNGIFEFTVGKSSPLKIEVFDVNGNLQKKESLTKAEPGVYHFNIPAPAQSNGMLIIQASNGHLVRTFRYIPLKNDVSEGTFMFAGPGAVGAGLAKIGAGVDSLKVSAAGYSLKKLGLDSYDATINVTLEPEPIGTVPKVTTQNATSIPAALGTAIANPGKYTGKTYSAYYYNTNGSFEDIFKTPVKQGTALVKPVNIYTPPGYDPQKQYPVIFILHGYGNHENRFNELAQPKLVPLFDNLITSNATKPFIAVFPNGTVGGASNANGYYNFGGELMNDLIPFIEANYSIRKDRGSRAIAGFSFGGMQTIAIGLCAHLKDFAWFAGLDPAGPGTPNSDAIAKYVAAENPAMYPVHYFYISVGASDPTAGSSSAAAANGLTTKSPSFTTANFSFQNNIPGAHTYPVAEVGLYNFLRMAFSPNY
ncbi:MAG: alpha/beta hydrolase-fold protein [Fibrobacteria bacterium]